MSKDPLLPISPQTPSLSIVLATLNERTALPTLLERLHHVELPRYELVIVDDGSMDGTREYVQDLAARDSRVRVLLHSGPRTLIPAQSDGIEAARGEFVIIMDSDLQHPPEKVPELYRQLVSGAGLVLASRYQETGSPGQRHLSREAISRGAGFILRIAIPEARRVSDPLSGFYGFRRSLFRRPEPMHRGYHMLPYLLVLCAGAPVREVPYVFGQRVTGTSKITQDFGFIPLFLEQVLITFRIRSALRKGSRPRVYIGPMSVPSTGLLPPVPMVAARSQTEADGTHSEILSGSTVDHGVVLDAGEDSPLRCDSSQAVAGRKPTGDSHG